MEVCSMSNLSGELACDNYDFLVAAKVRDRLLARKIAARRFHMRIFNLKKQT